MDVRKHVPPLTSARQGENGAGATPRKSKARAAMAVVVNDTAAVGQLLRAQANSRAPEGSQTNARAQNFWRLDLQHAAALGDDRGGLRWVGLRSALSALVPPKTQSFVRGIAYMSGGSSQTTA